MSRFVLTIDTDNAAFADGNEPGELGRILRQLGNRITDGSMPSTVLDLNGNTVGTVELIEEDDGERWCETCGESFNLFDGGRDDDEALCPRCDDND